MKSKILLLSSSTLVALLVIGIGLLTQISKITSFGFILTGFPIGGWIGILLFKKRKEHTVNRQKIYIFFAIILVLITGGIFAFRLAQNKWQSIAIGILIIATTLASLVYLAKRR